MGDVFHSSGGEIIQQDHGMALGQKRFGQVRSDESCSAGDEKMLAHIDLVKFPEKEDRAAIEE
jgi:hypothetical protein